MSEWKIKPLVIHTAHLTAKMDYGEIININSTVKARNKKEFEQKVIAKGKELRKGKYFQFFEGPQINAARITYYEIWSKY
jgi:hypothetical protein